MPFIFAENAGSAMNFLDASTMSALGSEPPVAEPPRPPGSRPDNLPQPSEAAASINKVRVRFFIRSPVARSRATRRKLRLQNGRENGDWRLSRQTAEIRGGRSLLRGHNDPRKDSPAANVPHPAAGREF